LRLFPLNSLAFLLAPAALVVAGCGGHVSAFGTNPAFSEPITIHAATTRIDTTRTTRYSATLPDGAPAKVEWSVSGGDPKAGAGTISPDGTYTPPSYLTSEAVTVAINALLEGQPSTPDARPAGSAELVVTPGFLQPLTPGNLSLGPNGNVTVSGSMTEVGGSGGIHFVLASDTAGTPEPASVSGSLGTLSSQHCVRNSVSGPNPAYTTCSVTYTAPANIAASTSVYILGSVTGAPAGIPGAPLSWTRILLNAARISSNPAAHQAHLAVPVQLGSSSGNNSDYDSAQGQLSDCCGGTLGALLQDSTGTQYVLSNNHVLARSDQSLPGETIIQPGLIDNGCTPYGIGPGTTPVATLTGYPELRSSATNVDAAIARVTPGAVDSKGNILELGAKQQDGTLASAPPGTSSTNGKGEGVSLGMSVAKSGRTTGLTCAQVSAVNVDVLVDYYTDCAETSHAFAKTFTNQIAISGTSFSDAGDSGALIVDTNNAEPVGLFFAGGTDASGVEHAIANPVGDVLAALNEQVPANGLPTNYSFVGTQDHLVSCLSYGSGKSTDDSTAMPLSLSETERVEAALPLAQSLLVPATGVTRLGVVASKDNPGQGAIGLYLEPTASPSIQVALPAFIGNIPTEVVPSHAADTTPSLAAFQPRAASMAQVLAVKQRNSASIMKSNPAIFGVGVGQSLDNPSDAALVVFVDRKKVTGKSPQSIEGQRVRVILMDRLHVTRAHGTPVHAVSGCLSSHRFSSEDTSDLSLTFEDHLNLPQ
jgi:hypothetical protein